jgi:hypothetical protein
MTGVSASIEGWFRSRIPDHWDARGLEIISDQDEILVVVDLAPDGVQTGGGQSGGVQSGGRSGDAHSGDIHSGGAEPPEVAGIRRFREMTRDERMAIARAAEQNFAQKVSWGARAGDVAVIFTTTSVPVMTRLRLPERRVLDTLIDAGVARSRSEALAWCVRLVGEKEQDWIRELRTAFEAVEATRAKGPKARRAVRDQTARDQTGRDQTAGEPATGDSATGNSTTGDSAACD